MHKCKDLSMKMWWSLKVWPKWQVVIPKEIRDLIGIKPWDTLVALTKGDTWFGFVKNEDFFAMMEYMKDEIAWMEDSLQHII